MPRQLDTVRRGCMVVLFGALLALGVSSERARAYRGIREIQLLSVDEHRSQEMPVLADGRREDHAR